MKPQSLPLAACLSALLVRPGAAQPDHRHPIRTSHRASRSRLMRFRPALAAIVMWWITFTACSADESSGPGLDPPMEPPPLIFASMTTGTTETCGVTTDHDSYCWGGVSASSDGSSIGRARREAMFQSG